MWITNAIALLYAACLLLDVGAATPLRRPLSDPKNVRRAALSNDPSCPDGFFCQQQSCPGDVVCPSGEECLNFEGNFACAPRGLKWCALNPSSFEAVECSSGSCCHGNCYSSGAVCCDFPSIKCSIGQLCNVCSPNEQCGDNQCVGSNPPTTTSSRSTTTNTAVPPPSTTTSKTTTTAAATTTTTTTTTTTSLRTTSSTRTSTTTTTSVPATTTTTTTTKSSLTTTSSTLSSTTKTSSASSTSSTQPSPTIVNDVDSFSFTGCFADTTEARVLVADSLEDESSTGMTPEECVNFARQNAWRYAGVEYSYQCFVGNTIHDADVEDSGDCDMACAGNPGQTCGGGNRIQIYEDSSWKDPTLDELADAIRQYNSSVQLAREVISSYQGHLVELQDLLQTSSSAKVKRDNADIFGDIELQIMGDRDNANTASKSLGEASAEGERTLELGRQLDTVNEDDAPVSLDVLQDFEDAVTTLAEHINDAILDMETNIASLSSAIATGEVPEIDISVSLSTIGDAIATIGLPVGPAAGVATGIFFVMASLLSLFTGGSTGVGQTTTLMPTSTTMPATTTTTTSTSTTCSATSTPTTIIIFTKEGTSVSEFDELVAGLPKDPTSIQLTNSWQPNFMYVGEVDQCTAEALSDNPIVDSWAIDADVEVEDFVTDDTSTAAKRSTYNGPIYSQDAGNNTKRGVPTAQSTFFEQASSPSHLQWISQVSRYTALTGNYYSFDNVIYNEPELPIGDPPIIYVIDTGFDNQHPDFADRVIAQLAVDDLGQNIIAQTAAPSSHGTCMVSLAAGSYSGMGKNARIVTVQLQVSKSGVTNRVKASRVFFMLQHIYHHIIENNAAGNAVISMSFGVPKASLSWGIEGPGSQNVFETALNWFWAVGAVTIASAGNDETSGHEISYKDLSSNLPRGAGGAKTNLIVVGNSMWDNSRHESSNYRDVEGLGILSLYNLGTNVECAVLGDTWDLQGPGSSQATAITAGMAAYYLHQPDLKAEWTKLGAAQVPVFAKKYLLDTARQYKGDFAVATPGDNIPRAALGEIVPCTGGTAGRPVPQGQGAVATDHTLSTTQVTEGSEVVLAAELLPQCWDLN